MPLHPSTERAGKMAGKKAQRNLEEKPSGLIWVALLFGLLGQLSFALDFSVAAGIVAYLIAICFFLRSLYDEKSDDGLRRYESYLRGPAANIARLTTIVSVVGRKRYESQFGSKVDCMDNCRSSYGYSFGGERSRRGRLKEAMEHYQEAINYDSEFAEAYVRVGILLSEQSQLDKAVEYFRYAVGLRPSLADARLNLARALAALGRKQEAVAEYEEAKRLLQAGNIPPRSH